MTERTVAPPEPANCWPSDLELVSKSFDPGGEIMFESTGRVWSEGRRGDQWVQLDWEYSRFHLTQDRVTIDAAEPTSAVDLYWNILLATVYELRGRPAIHGFMAESPEGAGLAVLGLSGSGKTTTGRALLDLGCRLVADDLIIIERQGVLPGRPFVRRADAYAPKEKLDIGGKYRVPAETSSDPVPLTNILVLCPDDVPQLTPLDSMTAANLLLQGTYVPFEVSTTSARRRLEAVLEMLHSGVTVSAAKSRTAPPHDFANYLLDQAAASSSA
jgi:hypothetical protein